MTFRELGLIAPILTALKEQGYEQPSPIQEKAIPPALAGRDVLGCAQTGTGKTCAFATPILQRLSAQKAPGRPIRALILTPTRELAIQIGESFDAYGQHLKLRHTVIFGGVGQNPQAEALKQGVDILVATPGRLMDLYNQKLLTLDQLEIFVLDEADRMLDMGFIHDVKKILKWLPQKKQTLFFSATMPPEITDLVNSLLKNPARVAVNPVSSPVEAIRQQVCFVDKANKTALLAHLMETRDVKNALVFTRTKHGANKVARDLGKLGITAAAIHGNKSQTARQQALSDFKSGKITCLVATDIAARGLDIEELSHVFNYNLPEVPETFVHRIGRTGRAGRGGEAIAFCDFGEQALLKDIEKLMGMTIPRLEDHPFPMQVMEAPKRDKHGKIINEEDAEARAAAREKRRQRDEAAQSAAREKRLEEQERRRQAEQVLTQPAPLPEEEKSSKSRRKRKKKSAVPTQQETTPNAPAKPEKSVPAPRPAEDPREQEDSLFGRLSRWPKLTRSGTLLDTGDAMPNTEFHRPNPLDSDVIMDATARLLAPRRAAVPVTSVPTPKTDTPAKKEKKKKAVKPEPQPEPTPAPAEEKKPTKSRRKKKKPAAKAAPASKAEDPKPNPTPPPVKQEKAASKPEGSAPAPKKKKKSRSRSDRQGLPQEHRRQHKDSTEQPSLMKPYYLDLGK